MTTQQIRTVRLNLRLTDSSDLDSIHSLHSLPEVDEYNTLGIPEDLDTTKAIVEPWIKENQSIEIKRFTFSIINRSTEEFIGLIALVLGADKYKRAEVWYKIHSDHWNNGYASESLIALIDYGFEKLKLHRIEAGCAVDNVGSIKVLEKSGMKKEGHLRQILPLRSGWSDSFTFAILETDIRP